MRRITYLLLLTVLLISVIIEGAFLYQEIAKTKILKLEISRNERQAEELASRIGTLEEQKREHEQEIERLKQQEEELVVQKDQVNRRVYDLARNGYAIKPLQRSQESIPLGSRYIRLTAPNGGETLCLGEEYVVRWESRGISKVQIVLRGKGVGGSYLEFDYPANLNETGDPFQGTYLWKVGKVGERDGQDLMAPPGEDYTFSLFSYNGTTDISQMVSDKSDTPFSIVQCEE